MDHDGPVVIHRSEVIETGRDRGYRLLGEGQELIGLDALDPQQLFQEASDEADEVREEILRRGHKIGLADGAVQRALDLAIRRQAELEDGAEAAGGADDVAVLRGCWGRSEREESD